MKIFLMVIVSYMAVSELYGVQDGWLVVLGLTALWDSISVYIGPSPREREKEERNDRREKKMSNQPPTRTYCKHSRPLPYYNPNK